MVTLLPLVERLETLGSYPSQAAKFSSSGFKWSSKAQSYDRLRMAYNDTLLFIEKY